MLFIFNINSNDEEKMGYVEKLLPIGTEISAKIIKYEKEPKLRINLGTNEKYYVRFSENNEEKGLFKDLEHINLLI